MDELEIYVKITDKKCLKIGKAVWFGKEKRIPVGFCCGDSIVFAKEEPKTIIEARVYIYTITDLAAFYKNGCLQGLIDNE